MNYQLNTDDRDLCEFDIWAEPSQTFAYGPPYDLIFWHSSVKSLCGSHVFSKQELSAIDKYLSQFAAVYIAAQNVFIYHELAENNYKKSWTQCIDNIDNKMGGNCSGRTIEYIKRGWISKAPNNEEDFIKWAVYPMQDPESFRKDYRITQDLRKAYRQLIKAAGPYIKAANNVEKAEKLYKDFYNFTALEWLIVLPM